MNVEERNEQAKLYVSGKLDLVDGLSENDFLHLSNYKQLSRTLSDLINVKAMGFRGVVATAITGMSLNSTYDPLNDFYGCNPRSIFEKGIFYAFENRVPCGKSDPLNVAKNISVLDTAWAKGKRPQAAAQAAVDCITAIVSASDGEKEDIINFFFFRLLDYSNTVANISIAMPTQGLVANQAIASKLVRLVLEFPESGTIPQLVISMLLKKAYELSQLKVEGGDESVFGTNTTSKKPADIWIENEGEPTILYEVTVKTIDYKRLDDCIQSVDALGMIDKPISFICRIPNDITGLSEIEDYSITYKGKVFGFVDIAAFIHSLTALLTPENISELLADLQEFMEMISRPVTTKDGWNKIMAD
jgi:hypothetical protein